MHIFKKRTPEQKSASRARVRKTLLRWGRRNQLIIILNIILVVLGLSVFVVGVVYEILMGKCSPFLDDSLHIPPSMTVSIGVVIAFAAGLAVWGALVGSYAKMYASSAILFFFIFLQMLAAGTAFIQRENISAIRLSKLHLFTIDYDQFTREVDKLQNSLKCCGYKGVIPRQNSSKLGLIAQSCCATSTECHTSSEDKYPLDCGDALEGFLGMYGTVIFSVSMFVVLYEIITMLFGCFVGGAWRDKMLIREAAIQKERQREEMQLLT